MVVTYYADVLFVLNFVLDFLLLFLIHPERKKSYIRMTAAALFGAGTVIPVLCLMRQAHIISFFLRFVSAAIMTAIAIPYRGVGELFCNVSLLYGIGGCLCGITDLVSGMPVVLSDVPWVSILVSVLVLLVGKILYSFRKNRYRQSAYQFTVKIKSGEKQVTQRAFYDSGNHLFEPISGRPVMLVRNSVIKLLDNKKTVRVVPYSSLGKNAGLLEAYPVEEVTVCDGKSETQFKNIYIALADDKLFEQEACDVILHAQQGKRYE